MAIIRVSILSDDKIFSDGLHRILAADGSFTLAALAERRPVPSGIGTGGAHVLLMDARLDDALGVCARMKRVDPGLSIIFIEVPEGETFAADALTAGARGILQRSARPEDVAAAIRAVSSGQVWAPRQVIVAAWLRALKREPAERGGDPVMAAPLTARERQVLHFAAAGLGNKEVAEALAISEATVKVHLTRIFQKLGLRGRARLAAAYHGVTAPGLQVDTPVETAVDHRVRRPA